MLYVEIIVRSERTEGEGGAGEVAVGWMHAAVAAATLALKAL
jgi:hypothetical protein